MVTTKKEIYRVISATSGFLAYGIWFLPNLWVSLVFGIIGPILTIGIGILLYESQVV
jgi:hypothetical protein